MQLEVPGVETALSVRLRGDPARQPLLVFGHGAGAGVDHPLQQRLAGAFEQAGLATLRYQFPFMERQGGRGFGRDPLPVALATVAAAVELARTRWPQTPLLAGGHSYGGRMTSLAAAESTGLAVNGLILCSFPLHAARRPAADRADHWSRVPVPVLLLSGARDVMAHPSVLEPAVEAAGPAFTLRRIAGADHGWQVPRRHSGPDPLAALATAAAEWYARMAGSHA